MFYFYWESIMPDLPRTIWNLLRYKPASSIWFTHKNARAKSFTTRSEEMRFVYDIVKSTNNSHSEKTNFCSIDLYSTFPLCFRYTLLPFTARIYTPSSYNIHIIWHNSFHVFLNGNRELYTNFVLFTRIGSRSSSVHYSGCIFIFTNTVDLHQRNLY